MSVFLIERRGKAPAAWWLSAVALLWSAALPTAALGASTGRAPWAWLAPIVYGIGHVVCHQRPERSFAWASAVWPVCARCSGIYAGAAVGAVLGLVMPVAVVRTPTLARAWVAVGAIPIGLTLVFEWTTGQVPSNTIRALSGCVFGVVVGWLLTSFVGQSDEEGSDAHGAFSRLR